MVNFIYKELFWLCLLDLKKKASILFALRVLKLLVGIFNLSLSAKYFGVSEDRDIWLLALNGVIILDMALWGPINETFRTRFIYVREQEGEAAALLQTRSLIFFTFLISLFITTILLLQASSWGQLLAPDFAKASGNKLSLMLMVLAPSFLVSQLTLILTSVLNAYNSFYVPEITSFLTAIINLLLLVLLAPIVGIYSLAVSYYIGLLLLLALLVYQLHKKKLSLFKWTAKPRFSHFKLFFLYALPFFLPYFLGQLNGLVEKALASSLGEGFVSVVDYGKKFPDMALTVMSSVLTTMLVPTLSSAFSRRDSTSLQEQFRQIYQLGILIIGLMIAFLTTSALPLIGLFYDKGAIPPEDLQTISDLAMQYSWAALAVFIYLITGLTLMATDQRKRYAVFGMAAQVVMIIINWSLVPVLGVHIFPLAMLAAHMVSAICMLPYLPYPKKELIQLTAKYVLFFVAIILPCLLLNHYLPHAGNYFRHLCINTTIILGLGLINLFLFKIEERLVIIKFIQKIGRR